MSIIVHYHEFILALFEHLLEDLRVVDSIVVLNRCKLSCRLSVSCHVVESLFLTCFAVIISWMLMRSSLLWRTLIEDLMLMNDLVVIVVIHVHFSWMAVAVNLVMVTCMLFT